MNEIDRLRATYELPITIWFEYREIIDRRDIKTFKRLYQEFAVQFNRLTDHERLELVDLAQMLRTTKHRILGQSK